MDKKMLTIILAIVLIGSFFLAYLGPANGLDLIQIKMFGWERYVLILIPLSGVLLLIGALNNGNYIGGRTLWTWLPLLAVIFWIVGMPLIEGGDIGTMIKTVGIGLWIAAGASLVLAFYNPKAKA